MGLEVLEIDSFHNLDEVSYNKLIEEIGFLKDRVSQIISGKDKDDQNFSEMEIRVQQYSTVVYILNKFFSYTVGGSYLEDKMGSCRDYDGLQGFPRSSDTARYIISKYSFMSKISLGDIKRISDSECQYHSKDVGCTLDILKPLICVAHADGFLPYSYDGSIIRMILVNILFDTDFSRGWIYVEKMLEYSELLLEELKNEKVNLYGINYS